ncbi:MAG: hypothetical protein JKX70_11070 [Phycisphaerales bacterium]|nr:hypothetical protein [Phycisphaerales bacterium]
MSESTSSTATIYDESAKYWKLCTAVLGVGFVIAVASHGGPASASAGTNNANLLTQHQSDAAMQANQVLSIGGFDSVSGEPMFVIVNEDGQRVGTLPMNAMNSD